MSTVEIDSLLNAEEGNISRLIYISRTPPIISLSQGRLICSNCGKDKNTVKNLSEKDLKRWGIENDGDLATNCFARSKCCCGHGNDGQRKNETHKFKKKLSTSNSNVTRNDQSSSKDFISHNIKTCDAYRFRENWPTQKSSLFHHYKHLGDYMDQYRACKIEKLEHNTTYLLDQSLFSEEVYNSISNSLSKFMENVALDEQTSNRHKESLVQKSKSDHRVNEMKPKKQTSVNPYVFNDTGIQEMQRSQYLKSLELCMKCGDNLKQQDVFSSLSYAGKQDRDYISRFVALFSVSMCLCGGKFISSAEEEVLISTSSVELCKRFLCRSLHLWQSSTTVACNHPCCKV